MTFAELCEALKARNPHVNRAAKDDYLEVVIAKEDWEAIKNLLEGYYGKPVKREGESPSTNILRLVDQYGGIRRDQILYYREEPNGCYSCALLWPWGCGYLVTLKTAFYNPLKKGTSSSATEEKKKNIIQRLFGFIFKK